MAALVAHACEQGARWVSGRVVGLRLQDLGIDHVHAHFAGMAARTAFWIAKFFPITFSFTAHANDIFAPRTFEIGLDKLVELARVIITETDYSEKFLRERFPNRADRIHRVYNGLNLAEFGRGNFSCEHHFRLTRQLSNISKKHCPYFW